jgi:hypothetical protein
MSYKNMENEAEKNKIFKYLLVVFFAVFIGTGIFLLLSNKSKNPKEKISSVRIDDTQNTNDGVDFPEEPTAVIPTNAPATTTNTTTTVTATPSSTSMTLATHLSGAQMKVGDMVELSLFADSNGKNIVGYDVVIYYDSLAFDFKRGLSSLSDYNIFTYKKGHYFTITGLKTLQSVPSPMTKANKLATLTFEATKLGSFEFALKPSNNADKTDLITDKTEVLVPELNKVIVNVN